MENQKRDFKGIWIPKEIWFNEELTCLEKIILMEVDSLDNEETGCYASNEYLAKFCQCSANKVSVAISKLIKLGYITVQSFDGRTRILKSSLFKKQSLNNEKTKSEYVKNKQININDNIDNKDNNISNINITNMENSKNSEITIEETKIDNIENPKKKKTLTKTQINAIERTKILEEFIKDEPEELKKALRDYVDVRQNERNLQAKQLQIILEDFEKVYKNKPLSEILTQIRKATARGWAALVYEDKFNQSSYKSSYSSKPSFDNTANHDVGKAVADMTPEEYEYYCQHQLARDENGNYIKF